MPKTYNPIKKDIIKAQLLQGKSAREALKIAKYGRGHIQRSTSNKIVKDCIDEIRQEFKLSDVTPEYIISQITHLAKTSPKHSDRLKALELLGRFRALFTDKQQVNADITTQEGKAIIDRYIQRTQSPTGAPSN